MSDEKLAISLQTQFKKQVLSDEKTTISPQARSKGKFLVTKNQQYRFRRGPKTSFERRETSNIASDAVQKQVLSDEKTTISPQARSKCKFLVTKNQQYRFRRGPKASFERRKNSNIASDAVQKYVLSVEQPPISLQTRSKSKV